MATQLKPPARTTDLTAAASVETAAAAPKIPKWQALLPLIVTIVLAILPPPPGLASFAWLYFSIFAGVIVGLILEPLPGAAIALIGLTLVTVLARFALFSPDQLSAPGFRPASAALTWALSGYSNPTVWLIFGAFIIALGYDRTGLGHRIALLIVKKMGKSTLLLGYGITLADTLLAPF
ncbi:MAG TPA: SLC13 family permease, partial [Candidatus Acidoferrales bacterium]|nr:SLC13 family permease [Candidatus Acidoferrales bacterium]